MGKRERRAKEPEEVILNGDALEETLRALMADRSITIKDALGVPSIAACTELISSTVAALPVRLFEKKDGVITELQDDYRLRLLNNEPGDLLDALQWKKALVRDYLLSGNGYSFVDWRGLDIAGIYYVDPMQVGVNMNSDPIYKYADFLINGYVFREDQILRILRNTKNGATGKGIVTESERAISTMVEGLLYERGLFRTGARKGFLKSEKRLEDSAMNRLSGAIKRLFSNEGESVVVLNKGVEYQPAGQTAVETQLNENKKTNGQEVCKMFCLSPKLFEGGATPEDRRISAMQGIIPVANALVSAFNKYCLRESEKDRLYFAMDTDDLLQGSMLERYQAYEIAARNGFMQMDEVRYRENMSPLGLDFIKLGLDTVLYNPKTKEVYTPNTDKLSTIDNTKMLNGSKQDEPAEETGKEETGNED
ncbi:MAG: phage portal protein [Firmicutes bacterium]|nr:phage portal protein [Bacillota bacterium]